MTRGDETLRDALDDVALAELCFNKGLTQEAARFHSEAFARDRKRADDLKTSRRLDAAGRAAWAGCGRGKAGPTLDAAARAGLRARALGWLKADLALRSLEIAGGDSQARSETRDKSTRWRREPDLALVREAEDLARPPEAERAARKALRAEVDDLIVLSKLGWSRH